jgi:hypothetical protein
VHRGPALKRMVIEQRAHHEHNMQWKLLPGISRRVFKATWTKEKRVLYDLQSSLRLMPITISIETAGT